MLILALDTSSAAGSAAVVRDGRVLVERTGDAARTHGERLPRDLMTLLEDARVDLHELTGFAIANGPGSFTGLRIGIAAIQGLALAQGSLVTPVSTFDALAAASAFPTSDLRPPTSDLRPPTSHLRPPSSHLAVWIDAHRGEVFATLYAADGTVLHAPTSLSPAATLDAWAPALASAAHVQFAGDGALTYRDVIDGRLGAAATIPSTVPLLAGAIGLIAARDPSLAVRPHAIVPLYVRRPDAELARDRRLPPQAPA